MRLLATFTGGTGHFLPLTPLAEAARAAGHTVAFAGQQGMLPVVEDAGFTAFATGGDTLLATQERTPLQEVDAEHEARVVREVFAGRVAAERADGVLALCGEWQPDVVVSDEMDFGAIVAAERLGLPHVTFLCFFSAAFVPAELVGEPLDGLRATHGLPPDPQLEMLRRHLVLSPFPAGLREPQGAQLVRSVALAGAGDGALAAWLQRPADRPLVYFTLGTVYSLESGDLFERVLAGLASLPVDTLVTVGRELDPGVLRPQPANVRVEQFVPQSQVLPRCSLALSHAGAGSVLGALTHGTPMLLLPLGADQPLNAERCAELGVARVLDPVRATADDVREAASAVMGDASYRERAGRLAAEIAAMPPPSHAVGLLEEVAGD